MNLAEIKIAVDAGQVVHWKSRNYTIIRDLLGSYLIAFAHGTRDANYIGLTWLDGVTMNGNENEFFMGVTEGYDGKLLTI